MADIELVIKIPEDVKNRLCFGVTYQEDIQTVCKALNNGTPLPKGHGRLIDADNVIPLALKKKTLVLEDTDLIDIRSREFVIDYLFKDIKDYINNMPTIIEADKESK